MPRPRHPKPAEALLDVAPLVTRWMERVLAGREPALTLVQWLTLRAVGSGETLASRLARAAGVSDAAVSQVLAGLERMQLVARARAEGDRRHQPVRLTAAGRRELDTAAAELARRLGAMLEPLPRPQADGLADGLRAAAAALAGVPLPRRPPPPPPRPRPRYDRRA